MSLKVEEIIEEVSKLGLGSASYRQSLVYNDFHGDVQHHHGSHTYCYVFIGQIKAF